MKPQTTLEALELAAKAIEEYRTVTLCWLAPELLTTAQAGLNAIHKGDDALAHIYGEINRD